MRKNEEIIDLLKLQLDRKDMSISELSRRVGMAKSAISRYMNKEREFPLNRADDFAKVLDLNVEYLLGLDKVMKFPTSTHKYFDIGLSAGIPHHVEAITDAETIEIPDSIMGKHAGQSDIFITKVNGQSMNKVIPDQSLIAVKPIDIHQIKNGDIVVYSDNGDYSVKRFYKNDTQLIFRPESYDSNFFDYITSVDNENLIIHGKVVVYIVTLD